MPVTLPPCESADVQSCYQSLVDAGAEADVGADDGGRYLLRIDGRVVGPVSRLWLEAGFRRGQVSATAYVRPVGEGGTWVSIHTLELARSEPSLPPHCAAAHRRSAAPAG